jgi:hypothetical protein
MERMVTGEGQDTGSFGPPPEWWQKQTEVEGRMMAVEKDVKAALDAAKAANEASTQASNRVTEVANLIQTHVQVDEQKNLREEDERRRTRRRVELLEQEKKEEEKTSKANWFNVLMGVSIPLGLALLGWVASTLVKVSSMMEQLPKP